VADPLGEEAMTVTDQLWENYRKTGDPEVRSQLLNQYLGLVHYSARELAAKIPQSVELDDLVSAGTLGLIQALEGFDPSRGHVFSTYAMQRIRGAMLDDLRSRDWMPRSVRSRARKLADTTAKLEAHLGRPPTHREIAAALEVDQESYWRQWVDGDRAYLVPLEGNVQENMGGLVRMEETVADPEATDASARVAHEEDLVCLREAVAALPQKERVVLALYYYEDLNLRQIGEVLHLTESRVSQIRSQALRRLRSNAQLAEALT
jgi:RNA polymerase sigma factor for flagellar operon FliA